MSSVPSPYIHPSKIPLLEIKGPTITKIELSEVDLDKLQKVLNSQKMSPSSKDPHQRKIIGMCGCGGIPDYILTKYYDGVKLIEK